MLYLLYISCQAYAKQKQDVEAELQKSTSAQAQRVIEKILKSTITVDSGIDVFASVRQTLIQNVLSKLDQENAPMLESIAILDQPLLAALKLVKRKSELEQEITDELGVNKMAVIAGPIAGQGLTTPKPMGIKEWFEGVRRAEIEKDVFGMTGAERLLLVNSAQTAMNEIMRSQASNENILSLALEIAEPSAEATKKKPDASAQVQVTRAEVSNRTPIEPLSYWGRVVDGTLAPFVKPSCLLPLKPAEQNAPDLYIDGTKYLNLKRSESCVAWHISVVPKPKEKDEDVDEPKAKKRKTILVTDVEEKKIIKKSALGISHEVVATHAVDWVPMTLEVRSEDGVAKSFEYLRPVLTDNEDFMDTLGVPCYRLPIEGWDYYTQFEKEKKEKEKPNKSFVLG